MKNFFADGYSCAGIKRSHDAALKELREEDPSIGNKIMDLVTDMLAQHGYPGNVVKPANDAGPHT